MTLNHLHFKSARPEATQRFYEGYFGFRPHYRLGETVVLVNDEHFLLAVDRTEEPATESERLHFGFCVRTSEEVDRIYAAMERDGVAFAQTLKQLSPAAKSFYCWDPSGNQIEVGWYQKLNG